MRSYVLVLAAVLALDPRSVRADTSSAEMVEKGIQLRREHRDAEALEQFRRAEQLNPSPRIRAQISLAEQALGQWVEAERDLTQALSAKDDPWIAERAAALKKALAVIQQHLGTLTVESNVNGAELWLNGARHGQLPMAPARVVSGTTNIELRAKGYETARRSIDVPPELTLKERVELTPAPAPPPGIEPAPAAIVPTASEASTPPSTQKVLAWGTLSAAGALLGAALAAQFVVEQNARIYNDDSRCAPSAVSSRDERCGTYRARVETAQMLANVGYVGAGAFGIASAVLFLTAPPSRDTKSSALVIDPLPGGVGVGWRGRF